MRGAAESVPPRPRASPGLRGVDAPRLARKLVDASPEALRSREGLGRLRHPHRPHGRAGEEGITALATADRAQGVDGAEDTRRGGDPACPMLPQGSPWPQTVPVAMGSESLSPGRPDVEATAWAPQVLAAALAPRLAGSLQRPREPGAFVDQDACLERLRQRQAAVARRHGQALGLAVCAPRRLRPGLPRGAVAIAACVRGRALTAALRPLGGLSPARSGTPDPAIVPHGVMARWPMMGGAIRGPRVPPDGGNVPRRSAWGLPLRPWGTAGGVRKHAVTPSGGTE